MRFLTILVFLLFCAYALFARWYFVCEMRGKCQSEPEDIRLKSLQLKDGETVILKGYDQFAFEEGVVEPRMNANNEEFVEEVANYLKGHSDKNLTITSLERGNG